MLFYFNVEVGDCYEDQIKKRNYTGFVSGESFLEAMGNLGPEVNFEDQYSSVISISLDPVAPDNYLIVCDDDEKLSSMVKDLALGIKETAIW